MMISLLSQVSKTPVDKICIDVANGYSQHFVDYVRKVCVTHEFIY